MAITLADFNKIWASSSPLAPYSFTENNYKQGWNFIGSTPPARQMWDYLQKYNDEKMQYLATNYLPLSGGTMTGSILSRYTALKAPSDDTYIEIDGGTGGGASLLLFGKDESRQGQFWLRANKTGTTHTLVGTGDGYLTWDGNDVITSAGGTFTGEIVRESATSSENFKVQRTDITKNTAPTATKYVTTFVANANGGRLSIVELTLDTNKNVRNDFRCYSFQGSGSTSLSVGYDTNNVAYAYVSSIFYPTNDNVFSLGIAAHRWSQVYAGTATINTSDERLKDNIEAIPDDVLDAWGEVNWYQYQFKDSIAEKGENARLHTGAIAQRIESVFEAHGLDANRYGLLCYDEWKAEEEQKDEDGNIVQEARPAGNRYSLRYEEALCMEAAYQRRRADRLEERIEALEKLLMNRTE